MGKEGREGILLGISGEVEGSLWTRQGVSILGIGGDVEMDLPLVGDREDRLLNLKKRK
jgi:hypothetical protein